MSIYVKRDYLAEYRRSALFAEPAMLDGVMSRAIPEFDAVEAFRACPPPSTGSVVDVGCGTGTLLRLLARMPDVESCALLGILPSQEEVSVAQEICDKDAGVGRISISVGTAEETFLPDRSQNVVYMNQMFHYVEPASVETAVGEVFRILANEGVLYIGALPDQDEFVHLDQTLGPWEWFMTKWRTRTELRDLAHAFAVVCR